MGLEINTDKPACNFVQPNFFINPMQRRQIELPRYVDLGQKPDELHLSGGIKQYATKDAVMNMIKSNPNVVKILKTNGVPLQINMKNLENLMDFHLNDTKNIATGIADFLPPKFQKEINIKSLREAAALHDFGKVLIPSSIVNKKGKLTPKETEIMRLHSVLGYELLKTTNLDAQALELIKYHHQNGQRTGYPAVNDFFVSGVSSQVIYAADVYSALIEKRPYKPAMSKNQALGIIHREMKQGNIHPYVFKALVDSVNKEENALNAHGQRKIPDAQPVDSLCA